ncbi:hypothetical protein F5ESL0236_04660 [Lactobacillus sp. ESL0236]|uniref:hypothetical protein n=1 Tax=unclassified Lactobacillus TaxID=2620435 RepID=UPI000EFC541C|nr:MULTISPECIES: hypothetical protein [unclassified Lactobacillus]RMC39551.1 hypothetical protein F5ESL0237_04650 [Lactobacillus sp. ESL0237]RMC43615.1 hypothetical protein F5ESL0234_04655 [Lactobacillus sp. ESL0234]RMC45097.1 hypothetical protein F5ESL0236_04660 [Lactobacillus sp. ESL0236]
MDLAEKTAELQKEINENSMWKQIGYISNSDTDCEPILLVEKHDITTYPIVIEAPTGLKSPKYDWTAHSWIENDPNSQGAQITALKEQLATAKQTIIAVQEQQTTVSKETNGALDKIQQTQEKQAEATAQLLQMLAPMLAGKPNMPSVPNVPTPPTPDKNATNTNTTTGGAK